MDRIFITGATGFIGSFVTNQLAEQGNKLICLVRKTSNLQWIEKLNCELLYGSLYEPDSYSKAIKNVDYIFHIAGITKALSINDYYRGNVLATKYLLDRVVAESPNLKRFLFVSSQSAVGPSPSSEAVDESVPCHPITDYGKSKMEAEQVVSQYMDRLPITIIRPPAVYGPRDTDVYHFFKFLKMGINLTVQGIDQLVSIIYVEDLARGIISAAFSPNTLGNTYFLCEEKSYLWSDIAQIASVHLGKKYWNLYVPLFIALNLARILELIAKMSKKPTILNSQKIKEIIQPYWSISPQKAMKDFGYRTEFPVKEGIQKTIDWYITNHWL